MNSSHYKRLKRTPELLIFFRNGPLASYNRHCFHKFFPKNSNEKTHTGSIDAFFTFHHITTSALIKCNLITELLKKWFLNYVTSEMEYFC